jgi:hypothetical protein
MRKHRLLKLLIILLVFPITISGQNLTEFMSTLKDCGMNLNIPTGFVESKIIENDDMGYEYAIKYPNKDFELRYAVRPIRYKVYANDTIRNEMEGQRAFRNSAYATIFKTVMFNITAGVEYKIQAFDATAVKNEFNADSGATSFVELKSDFGKGFKYCMMVTIHKDDVADAYYFYLSNSKEDFSENMKPLFHTLRFD